MIEFQNRHIKLPDGSPVIVCRIKGSIDGATLQQFEEKLLGFLQQGVKHLIVVFSQVRYINSTGMGVLVKLADKFQESGGAINLVDVPDKMVALFNMLGLLALINLSKSEEEALTNFQKGINSAQKKSILPPAKSKLIAPARTPATSAVGSRPAPMSSRNTGVDTSAMPGKGTAVAMTPAAVATRQRQPKKIYVITCKKCSAKISLGTDLKAGTYKCPRCTSKFKILNNGKIEYFP